MSHASEKLKAKVNEAVGSLKQTAGKAIGNPTLQMEGVAQQLKGKAQEAISEAKQALGEAKDLLSDAKEAAKNTMDKGI